MTPEEVKLKIETLEECHEKLEKKTSDTVSLKNFIWILGILVSLGISIVGWRINEVNILAKKVEESSDHYAAIQVQLSEIKVQQAEIMTEIRWMKLK